MEAMDAVYAQLYYYGGEKEPEKLSMPEAIKRLRWVEYCRRQESKFH